MMVPFREACIGNFQTSSAQLDHQDNEALLTGPIAVRTVEENQTLCKSHCYNTMGKNQDLGAPPTSGDSLGHSFNSAISKFVETLSAFCKAE